MTRWASFGSKSISSPAKVLVTRHASAVRVWQTVSQPTQQEQPMIVPKTLRERERELQGLVGTPQGMAELARLESLYSETGEWQSSRSVITNILIYERAVGLIQV
jgi:hypothetical protein